MSFFLAELQFLKGPNNIDMAGQVIIKSKKRPGRCLGFRHPTSQLARNLLNFLS